MMFAPAPGKEIRQGLQQAGDDGFASSSLGIAVMDSVTEVRLQQEYHYPSSAEKAQGLADDAVRL